jgi:glucosyl-dolichyl phosphate glucuronosyltransferase
MHISLALCTWNRSGLLRQTLERMATALRIPPELRWELLVVDNGSTDETRAVIEAYAGRLPVRYLFEPRQGLSHARNLAVAEAGGEYIVWTDDDVLVEPGWLEAYAAAFARRPDAAVFGGPIDPWFSSPAPDWLVRIWPHVVVAYAVRDLGPEEVPLTPMLLPYGANMAVRTAEQRSHPFDPSLGNRGAERIGGEETGVLREILAAGATGLWLPQARLLHYLPPDRLSLDYLRQYYLGRGRRLHADGEGQDGMRWGVPGWIAQLGAAEVAYRLGRVLDRPDLWARGLRRSWIARGYLGGLVTGSRR